MSFDENDKKRIALLVRAKETLKALAEWLETLKPSPVPVPEIEKELLRRQWADYMNARGMLMDKGFKMAMWLLDDTVAFMEEIQARPEASLDIKS
jgi:hypothetical protein